MRVTELEPKLNFPFPTGDYVTLGGLVYNRLGRVPVIGDVVDLEGGRLEVLEMDNHRVTSVMFQDLGAVEGGEIHLADDELNRNGVNGEPQPKARPAADKDPVATA